jgi:TP901 family phage tail tape measure protein
MSVRTDTINLNVNINGDDARNRLNNLKKSASDIKNEMSGLKKGTQEYINKAAELKKVETEMGNLKKQIGLTALTQKELVAELKKLNALKGSVTPFTEEYKELAKQIKVVENRLYDVKNGVQGFSSFFSKIKDEVKQFGLMAAGYLGFQFLTSQFQNIISSSGKLSDSLADIQRVTGMTAEEVQQLNKQLSQLDSRTSTQGLREIAVIAGKLGIAKNDILGFVEATDKLVVALGDELGDANAITENLGKILNVFDGKVTGENITQLGNALVGLANDGIASGGFLVDFSQRLSGIAVSANLSKGALLGFGAGLEESGARVESSATAMQKLIMSIAEDVPKAAKIAGAVTKDEIDKFSETFAKTPEKAILAYTQALVKNKSAFGEVVGSLKDAGEEGARTVETILKLGNGAEQFSKKIDDANAYIKDSSLINDAFALKNETLGASLDKLGKEFNKLMTSNAITGFLQSAVMGARNFIASIKELPGWIQRNSTALTLLALGIAFLNKQYIISAFNIAKETVAKIANSIATRATALANNIAIASTSAYIVISQLFTAKITLATAAQRLWNIAVSLGAGPIGIMIVAVGALVLALNRQSAAAQLAADIQRKVADATTEELQKIGLLKSVINDSNVSYDNRKRALNELIKLNPQYLSGLTLENMKTAEGKKILDGYIASLIQKAEMEAKNAVLIEKLKKRNELFNDLRSNSREKSLQFASDESLTQMITKPKGNDWQTIAQGASWGGVDMGELKETLTQINYLQTDITTAAKKNIETVVGTSNNVTETTTKTATTAATNIDASSKKASESIDNLRDKFDALMEKLNGSLTKLTEDPLAASFAQINTEMAKEIKLVDELKAKRAISNEEAAKAYDLIKQKAKEASDKVFAEFMDKRSQERGKAEIILPAKIEITDVVPSDKMKDFNASDLLEKNNRNKTASLQRDVNNTQPGTSASSQALLAQLNWEYQQKLLNTDLTEQERLLLEEEWAFRRQEIQVQEANAWIDNQARKSQYIIDQASTVNNILNNLENKKLNKELAENEKKKAAFKKQLDAKLINQTQYNQKVAQLDEESDKKKRRIAYDQAKREKTINIVQATLNGIVAVSKAAAAFPPPFNIPGIILETVRSGLLVAAAATTPLPELGKGDWIKEGDKHSDPSGGIVAKIERGEAVMNAATMDDNNNYTVTGTPAQITSALNNLNGNGVAWASGAVIQMTNWLKNKPAQLNPNMPRIMEQGGVVRPITQANNQQNQTEASSNNAALITEMKALRSDVNNWNTKLKGVWVLRDFEEAQRLDEQIKKASGIN